METPNILRTDGKEVDARKKEIERIKQYREDKDTRDVLSTAAGKRWAYRILEECGSFRTPFVPGDSYASHVNIGRQQIGLNFIATIERAAPMAYSEIIRQYKADMVLEKKLNEEAEAEMKKEF